MYIKSNRLKIPYEKISRVYEKTHVIVV
jgi:hypothetical protein